MSEKDEDSSRDSQEGPDSKGGFAPASDRPYAPAHPGQLEERAEDGEDSRLQSESKGQEATMLGIGESRNAQHGNIGFSGNYSISPMVEK